MLHRKTLSYIFCCFYLIHIQNSCIAAIEPRPDQFVYDPVFVNTILSPLEGVIHDLESASESVYTPDGLYLIVTAPLHSKLNIYRKENITSDHWTVSQIFEASDNGSCNEQGNQPNCIPELEGASGLAINEISYQLIATGKRANAIVVLNAHRSDNDIHWSLDQIITSAGSEPVIKSPYRVRLSKDRSSFYAISDNNGMLYSWKKPSENTDQWIHWQNLDLATDVPWLLKQILIQSDDRQIILAASTPPSSSIKGGILFLNNEAMDDQLSLNHSISSDELHSLNLPTDLCFARGETHLLVTSEGDGGSLTVLSRPSALSNQQHSTQQHSNQQHSNQQHSNQWHSNQVFSETSANASSISLLHGASQVVVSDNGADYQYAFVASKISNSLIVFVLPQEQENWNIWQIYDNHDNEHDQSGISGTALSPTQPQYLAVLGAYSKDINIFVISARPVFQYTELNYDYRLGQNSTIASINISFPNEGEIQAVNTNHEGFYVDHLFNFWLDPEWESNFTQGDSIVVNLVAIDTENQSTAINSTVTFVQDTEFPFIYPVIAAVLVTAGTVFAAVSYIGYRLYNKGKEKIQDEETQESANPATLQTLAIIIPEDNNPGPGCQIPDIQMSVVSVISLEISESRMNAGEELTKTEEGNNIEVENEDSTETHSSSASTDESSPKRNGKSKRTKHRWHSEFSDVDVEREVNIIEDKIKQQTPPVSERKK